MDKLLPSLFISHGMPTLALQKNAVTDALARMGQNLPKPDVVVVMSAHWVTGSLAVSTAQHLKTWHDFKLPKAMLTHAGISQNTLKTIKYPAKGAPAFAQRLIDWLHKNTIDAHADALRPLDHGVWVPLLHLYPEADVPVVQVSLPSHFDAHACYQLGAALAHFRAENVLIIGSGNITHNLSQLNFSDKWANTSRKQHKDTTKNDTDAKSITHHNATQTAYREAHTFKHWLIDKLKHDRPAALKWQHAPFASQAHPTKEHLLPLFFAAGAAQLISVVHSSVVLGTLGMDIYRFD